MRMNTLLRIAASAATVLVISGCASAHFLTEQDPAYTPVKSESVKVVLPANASEPDALLRPIIENHLLANGFNLAADQETAIWLLEVSCEIEVPGAIREGIAKGDTIDVNPIEPPLRRDTIDIVHMTLFKREDFASGKRHAVWSATATAKPRAMDVYQDVVIKDLLGLYGTSYNDSRHLR